MTGTENRNLFLEIYYPSPCQCIFNLFTVIHCEQHTNFKLIQLNNMSMRKKQTPSAAF
jgi:hypothetical protein